jgi:hypothetical protein
VVRTEGAFAAQMFLTLILNLMAHDSFFHLHLRTEYSMPDCIIWMKELMKNRPLPETSNEELILSSKGK